MELKLVKLSENDGADIYDMLQEIPLSENGLENSANGMSYEEFKKLVRRNRESSEQEDVIDGWKVPQTVYWLYDGEKPVGLGKVRHFLTDKLLQDGGNIGYAIRPSARGKGYSKELLRLLIGECSSFKMEKALITIHEGNIPSKRTALFNNGVIEKTENGLLYIWIDCEKQ